jgi:hypothetical protein
MVDNIDIDIYYTKCDAPDAHFNYLSLFSNVHAEKVGNPEKKKKFQNCESPDENQNESHEIEPNPTKDRVMHEGDNPSF